jgi:hypothetical protein
VIFDHALTAGDGAAIRGPANEEQGAEDMIPNKRNATNTLGDALARIERRIMDRSEKDGSDKDGP